MCMHKCIEKWTFVGSCEFAYCRSDVTIVMHHLNRVLNQDMRYIGSGNCDHAYSCVIIHQFGLYSYIPGYHMGRCTFNLPLYKNPNARTFSNPKPHRRNSEFPN